MKIRGFLALLLLLILVLVVWQTLINKNETVLRVNFFQPERFWDGVNRKHAEKNKVNAKIYAAVVPHHLVAGRLISSMFEELKNQDIKKIIVIGPNHYEAGREYLQSYAGGWETPFGQVRGDE